MADVEIEVVEYVNASGRNPFAEWTASLDSQAVARILSTTARMRLGNVGDAKPVGEGVSERRIHSGPGYRIYFGKDGSRLVILLGGGTKSRQSRDIEAAKAAWADYKQRKQEAKTNGTN